MANCTPGFLCCFSGSFLQNICSIHQDDELHLKALTFTMGIYRGLNELNLIPKLDAISSVSGGAPLGLEKSWKIFDVTPGIEIPGVSLVFGGFLVELLGYYGIFLKTDPGT